MLTIEVGENKLGFFFPNDHELYDTQNQNLNFLREVTTMKGNKMKDREKESSTHELLERKSNKCMSLRRMFGWDPKLVKGNVRDPNLKEEPS